jgi:hypothetical protein
LTVRHLSEGALRRLHDDRFAASNSERRHLDGCARCQARAQEVAGDADLARRVLAVPVGAAVAPELALAGVRRRLVSPSVAGRGVPRVPVPSRRRRFLLGAVGVPVLAAGLFVSADAAGWLTVFAPTHVAPLTITAADLNGLPDLSAYGSMRSTNLVPHEVSGAAAAAAESGMRVLVPGALPAVVPSSVRWEVIGAGDTVFTLDPAAASGAGHPQPAVPAELRGAAITVHAGPGVVAVFGSGSVSRSAAELPALVIAQLRRPTASTSGASLKQLEDFLLAQPGVSPQLAAAIRAIGEPASTLPIPVIAGAMSSQSVDIGGAQGVVVGDSTGLGSAVIWESGGVVYAVGGQLRPSEVVDIARSLH